MYLNIETQKTLIFPFGTNGKLMVQVSHYLITFGYPLKILKIKVLLVSLDLGTFEVETFCLPLEYCYQSGNNILHW